MTCLRCGGLMREEWVYTRLQRLDLWACLLCGDRLDETIRFHRAMRRAETTSECSARLMREMQALVQQYELVTGHQ